MKSSFHVSRLKAFRRTGMKQCGRSAIAMLVAVIPPAFAQSGHGSCVDVQVGTSASYDCINQKLEAIAHDAHQSSSTPTPDIGRIPTNQTGQFNESATRDRLGSNFGKSVTPSRPAANFPNTFAPPKTNGRHR